MHERLSVSSHAPRILGVPVVVAALLVLLGAPLTSRPASSAADAQDEDERSFRHAAAQAIVRDNCLSCHSEELVTGQKLTQAQWKAEVEKMVGWGAPVPADQVAPLVEYLAEQYSESTPAKPSARISYERATAPYEPETVKAPAIAGDAGRGGALYRAQCATCHGEGGRGSDLGPNLVEVPVLVRPAEYTAVVRDGRRRMPGFRLVFNPEQERDVLAWLRGRRYDSPAGR